MTVGIGATEEEGFASISGWTIILDVSMKSDECTCTAPTKSRRDEIIERNAEEKRVEATQAAA
jgi:hypothetical protein